MDDADSDRPGFYVVWNPKSGPPTYRHDTYASAEKEAERLAFISSNQTFFILRAVATARTRKPVEIRRVSDTDDIPF